MGFFDVKTLSFVALVTSLLLPLVLTTSAQFTSSKTPATQTLIRGALVYAIGFLLLALRSSIPDWLSFFIGNVLIVGGFSELAIGMQLYLRGHANRGWMVLITAGNALGMYWFVMVAPDPSQRVFTSSIFLLPICLLLALEFLAAARRAGASDERGASAEKRLLLVLAVVFFLSALSFSWRANNFWNVHGDINPATTGGQTWGLSFMVGVLLNIMLATCMPLLISRRNQRELAQNQALLEETERLADVGSFLYDPDTKHLAPNGVMAAWLGTTRAGHYPIAVFLNRLDPSHAAALQAQIKAIASGEQAQWSGQSQMTDSGDGTPRWLSMHCGSSRDASGRTHVIVSARNITEFQVATEAAIEARNDADRANAAKSAFLANMSHEIRTPMNGVLGLTRLCLDGELPPRERELIEKCHSSAQTLLGVVNDILDFSKIEAGKLVLEQAAFNLSRTVDNARNLFEQMAGSKGIRFVVDIADDVPPILVGDALRLSQILNNLLSNAVKFTLHGEVRLSIARAQTAEDGVRIAFAVQDTGIGMSPLQMAELFQAFSQADTSTTRRFGGTGLGLVICQRLAELMGGSITVDSVEGQGSTFTTTLPFTIAQSAQAVPAEIQQPGPRRLQGIRVLLVEDNPTNVLVARLSLEAQGAVVVHCGDGQQAVDYLRTQANAIDVVLMDIQMPVMDGYTATHQIRHTLGLSSLPIIAMTANVLETDREASRIAGMSAHVGKPFDMDQLARAILQSLGRVPLAEPLAPADAPGGAPSPEEPLVDLDAALQRLGGDVALLAQAADSFAQDLPGMLAAMANGASASLTPLHTFKGLSATLGLVQSAHMARSLETAAKSAEAAPSPSQMEALERLTRASLQSLHEQLQARAVPTPSPSTAAPSTSDARTVLQQLAQLLAQADLAALEYLAQHRTHLKAHLDLAPLEQAIQSLDLEAAAAECSRLLQVK